MTNERLGPIGQLASLRAEFDEFKCASAAEREAVISERDGLAKEVAILKKQAKDASLLENIPAKERKMEITNDTEDTECSLGEKDDNMEVSETDENIIATKKTQVENGVKQVLDSFTSQFDEDGYMKVLLPRAEEMDENSMTTTKDLFNSIPTTKQLVGACNVVKKHVEEGAQDVLVSAADQFDENGYMKCCLPQE
eukprot:CAMPEP_0197717388 /NCGR_PEP_ID=MMETSP1434-20131217/1941_1 /TAXON_ID=265543 /ORGANISM="Minutocellus polymorphus, Strain CCMP3303" /LENGTH=195 /DNA_ID=CAMNT_0043301911 /DNA_START=50 /DNA_END=637 /DNA_ORIENTATION=+